MNRSSDSALGLRDVLCQRDPLAVRSGRLEIVRGAFHVLRGEVSSGHELLLRVLGLLEVPESGEVFLEGTATREADDETRLKLRERRLGFVFAAPFLLPAFTVIENIAMPLFKISEVDTAEARRRSEELLEFVGLGESPGTPCAELPPLCQRRVALARALVNQPAAVLVENLDGVLGGGDLATFAALLRIAASRYGVAVVATVSPAFTPLPGDRVIEVADGRTALVETLPHADA